MYILTNTLKQRIYPIVVFAIIGSMNTLLYFSLFALFWNYLHFNYLLATSFTYVITALFQFFSNRKLTFKASGKITPQIVKYITLLGINYIVTFILMRFVVAILYLSPYVGLFLTSISSATISFIFLKMWVFSAETIQEKTRLKAT